MVVEIIMMSTLLGVGAVVALAKMIDEEREPLLRDDTVPVAEPTEEKEGAGGVQEAQQFLFRAGSHLSWWSSYHDEEEADEEEEDIVKAEASGRVIRRSSSLLYIV